MSRGVATNPKAYTADRVSTYIEHMSQKMEVLLAPIRSRMLKQVRKELGLETVEREMDKLVVKLNELNAQYKSVTGDTYMFATNGGSIGTAKAGLETNYRTGYKNTLIANIVEERISGSKKGKIKEDFKAIKQEVMDEIYLSKSPDLKAILSGLEDKFKLVSSKLIAAPSGDKTVMLEEVIPSEDDDE